jgi:hypothetical protein
MAGVGIRGETYFPLACRCCMAPPDRPTHTIGHNHTGDRARPGARGRAVLIIRAIAAVDSKKVMRIVVSVSLLVACCNALRLHAVRAPAPRMSCPLETLKEKCPLTSGAAPPPPSSPPPSGSPPGASASPPSVAKFLDEAERRVLEQAGLSAKPFAAAAAEIAIETVLRAASQELGSLNVEVNANSSAGLLLRGELLSARVSLSNVVALGLRATSFTLASDAVDFRVPSLLSQQLPNLKSPTNVKFGVTLSADNIRRSPAIFLALEEVLRELVRSGVSAAIGEILPRDASGLRITLKSVELDESDGGRLVLVADAEAAPQADGRLLSLQGLRVRTKPRVPTDGSRRLLVLDRPELLSTVEGFGAKVEVGLPFLLAAGVPLPEDVALTEIAVEDGALRCEGELTIQPVDYGIILDAANAAAAAAAQEPRRPPPSAVTVEVEPEAGREDDGLK